MKKRSKNIQTVLDILKDEVDGDIEAALKKITKDYTMTWVYKTKKELFPTEKITSRKDLKDIYPIKGRQSV